MTETRWTAETEEALVDVLDDVSRVPLGHHGEAHEMAEAVLRHLADAGLLVSPQILAVLEAAKRADKLHQTATFTTPFEDFEAVADDLHAAVDALEEANRQ